MLPGLVDSGGVVGSAGAPGAGITMRPPPAPGPAPSGPGLAGCVEVSGAGALLRTAGCAGATREPAVPAAPPEELERTMPMGSRRRGSSRICESVPDQISRSEVAVVFWPRMRRGVIDNTISVFVLLPLLLENRRPSKGVWPSPGTLSADVRS